MKIYYQGSISNYKKSHQSIKGKKDRLQTYQLYIMVTIEKSKSFLKKKFHFNHIHQI